MKITFSKSSFHRMCFWRNNFTLLLNKIKIVHKNTILILAWKMNWISLPQKYRQSLSSRRRRNHNRLRCTRYSCVQTSQCSLFGPTTKSNFWRKKEMYALYIFLCTKCIKNNIEDISVQPDLSWCCFCSILSIDKMEIILKL